MNIRVHMCTLWQGIGKAFGALEGVAGLNSANCGHQDLPEIDDDGF